ncbi:MAG: hypothetical protein ACM67S_00765 [Bacteroidota bacterium]
MFIRSHPVFLYYDIPIDLHIVSSCHCGQDAVFQSSIDVQLTRGNFRRQTGCLDLTATDRNGSFVTSIVIRIFNNDAFRCRAA